MLAVLLYSVNDEARKEGPHDLSVVRPCLRYLRVQKREADALQARRCRRELESSRTRIGRARQLLRASHEERIAGKLIKSALRESSLSTHRR